MFKKILLVLIIVSFFSCKKESNYTYLQGMAFGTPFSIKYKDALHRDMSISVDSLIKSVNKSLSTYQKNSDISKMNNGDTTIVVDNKFIEVFKKSQRIYIETNGVFDPTIGVLVNAWDFGPEKKINDLDSTKVNELMKQVGFSKVHIKNNKVIKENKLTYFDFNAIAKGYGIDVIGRFFETKNIISYMIEVGGEVRARGKSPSGEDWKIGIEKPNFDGSQSVQKVILLHNESIATSGTYRKFKIDINGNKYAHILNAKTGYPAKSDVLSASVISNLDCADVDGYATALLALGLERSKIFLKNHKDLNAFIIYSDENGKLMTYKTEGFDE